MSVGRDGNVSKRYIVALKKYGSSESKRSEHSYKGLRVTGSHLSVLMLDRGVYHEHNPTYSLNAMSVSMLSND